MAFYKRRAQNFNFKISDFKTNKNTKTIEIDFEYVYIIQNISKPIIVSKIINSDKDSKVSVEINPIKIKNIGKNYFLKQLDFAKMKKDVYDFMYELDTSN